MNYDLTDSRLTVSVKEASRLLGIGRTKIYELLNAGELCACKVGRRTLISVASIRRLVGQAAAQ